MFAGGTGGLYLGAFPSLVVLQLAISNNHQHERVPVLSSNRSINDNVYEKQRGWLLDSNLGKLVRELITECRCGTIKLC